MANKYDRQPKETAKAYRAFQVYCELGADRSLQKVADALSDKANYLQQIKNWSRKYGWVERAAEWDKDHAKPWENKEERSAYEADLKKYKAFQKQLAINASQSAIKLLQKLQLRIDQFDVSKIPDKQLPGMFKNVVDIAHSASSLWAQSLGIDELLEFVKKDGD